MKFSTVLNQLLQFLPASEFEKAIQDYKSDRYVKYFKTKALFVVHLYAQIRQKECLRDIVCGLDQHQSKWYHVGLERLKRSTISDANNRVPFQVYETLFYGMLKKCSHLTSHTKFKFKNPLYALDSSVIDLCLTVFVYTLLLAYIKNQTQSSFSILTLSRIFREYLFFRKHLIDVLAIKRSHSTQIRGSTQLSFC